MSNNPRYKWGAYVGRLCPTHAGHQQVYEEMRQCCENHIVLIGSANAPWSLPLFFDYGERSQFFKTLYSDARIAPLPDFETNALWLRAIRDLLLAANLHCHETVFFGGCEEDVLVLSEEGKFPTHFLNRFDGTTPAISATEIRDALIHGRPLNDLLDPRIQQAVKDVWDEKWPVFIKKR